MHRTLASRVVMSVGPLALAAALTGCGGATGPGGDPEPDPAAVLVCDPDSRQTATVALAAGEPGAASAEEAVRDGDLGGPVGQADLEEAPADADQVRGVVRDDGVVVAEVTVLQTADGWFLESVTTCG